MGHLLIDPRATTLWEAVYELTYTHNRPAMLESTDGVGAKKESIGNQLISVANSIKDSLDLSMFAVEHCGAEAHAGMKNIDASIGTISSAAELFSLKTKYVNMNDQLLQNLDSSGTYECEGSLARRLKCHDHFIGQDGRSKNYLLLYLMILWEGKAIKWLTKRLPAEIAAGSSKKTDNTPGFSNEKDVILTVKQKQKVLMMREMMTPDATPEIRTPVVNTSTSSITEDDHEMKTL